MALALLAGLFVATSPTAANAAPGDPFDSSRPAVFVSQQEAGYNWNLYRFGLTAGGSFQVTQEGPTVSRIWYNALGFNPNDDFLYAFTASTPNPAETDFDRSALIRIGQDHTITQIGDGNPELGPKNAGAFTPSGDYWVGHDESDELYRIDVATGDVAESLQLDELLNVIDFTYKDGYFWGLGTGGEPYDPLITRLSLDGDLTRWNLGTSIEQGAYGAAWTFGNGNLGFSKNLTGTVYQISVTNPAAANPVFEIVGEYAGPVTNNNDGANVPGFPADLAIEKEGPATFVVGGQVTYTLTVTNNGRGVSSGWLVNDTAPTGLENITATSDAAGCTVTDNAIQCAGGELEVGATATITVTGDVAGDVTDCLVNVAEVIGNEEDPDPENNEDSTTACREAALSIEKTSNATEDSRPGDVVTYTVTATNTGGTDYTADNPAVVFDDLSDVLDDADYNDNAEASQPGSLSYESPLLSWTGALPVDESVELTYSVTLGSAGDGAVRNVAWAPVDPENPTPPSCDPPEDGIDPETGEPCAEHEYLIPQVDVVKSSDPATGTGVQAGQEVTYTLTFTNTGQAAGAVDYTDDLAAVLDDADLTGAPVSSDPALAATDGANGRVRVTGTLAPEQTVTVTYVVTVKPDGEHGDNQLRNVVVETGEEPPATCEPGRCTEHPIGELDDWKTVDPATGFTLRPGETATYTLHFENVGNAPVEVNRDDVLTQVIDDADVTGQPVASSDSLTVSDIVADRFNVTGELAPGEVATVTYQVTVKPDGQRGDDRLDNFLVANGENPPEGPCVPADSERPDCTFNHVSEVRVVKSSDPESGSEVNPGEEVTYTLTFTNRSTNPDAGDVAVDYTDHMADVLDDATLTAGPTVSNDSLTATAEGDTIRVTGTVPTGAVYTVAYTVKVKAYDEQGTRKLANVVAVTGEEPVCVEGSPLCTNHLVPDPPAPPVAQKPGGSLAQTGLEILAISFLAALLLGAGSGLVLASKRRRASAGRQ